MPPCTLGARLVYAASLVYADCCVPPCTTHGRLRHALTLALIRMLKIVRIGIEEEYR